MSTSEGGTPATASTVPAAPSASAAGLAKEIERLANQFFSGVPAFGLAPGSAHEPAVGGVPVLTEALQAPPPLAMPLGAPASQPAQPSPLSSLPSALALGAGGASSALTAPPLPGFVKQPPLTVAPPPKESDLRAIVGLLSDASGASSPAVFASAPGPAPAEPYFLEHAGLPSGDHAPVGAPLPADVPAPPALAAPPLPTDGGAQAGNASQKASAGASPALAPDALPGLATEPYFLGLAGVDPKASPTRSAGFDLPRLESLPSAHGWPSALSWPLTIAPGEATGEPAASSPPATAKARSDQVRPELVPAAVAPTDRLFDGATVKKDFPILRERVHGRELVWLDNAATTQKPQAVIDRLSFYYEHENSNVHRAAHALAARATDAYEGAREKVRRFLNASSTQEIVFVRGTTEAINLVAQSWGRRNVGPGDEIVITWLEHHANIVPWQQLCAEKGACLRVAPVDARGQVILEEYERLLGPRTRLVSLSHVSNALGTIVPAREMVQMAHRHGALALVDGAQAVSHMRVDVQSLDCDFYCFSGHKVFAPMGIGALYGKRDLLNTMPPWQGGGNMIADVTFEKTLYQPAPQRFEAGTGSIGDAVGLGAALDYVTALGIESIARYEHELLEYATEHLLEVPGLRLVGTAPDKAGVLSFVLDGIRTEDVGTALDQEGIAVRAGHHCAQPILRRFGLESTVRASLAPYNTCEDIDALVAALLRLQAGRPRTRPSVA